MTNHSVQHAHSTVNPSPLKSELKIRVGLPPAPRAAEGIIFLHLAKSHHRALRERGWKFYVLHIENVMIDEHGKRIIPASADGETEAGK